MKRMIKIVLVAIVGLAILWTGLKLSGFKLYKLQTTVMENTVPLGTKFMIKVKNFHPDRFEMILYHNPDFDTVLTPSYPMGYYAAKRQLGSDVIDSKYQKEYVPLEEREQWLGRCVGLPGDKFEMNSGKLLINDQLYENNTIKERYLVKTKDNKPISNELFVQLHIRTEDVYEIVDSYVFPATKDQFSNLQKVVEIDTAYCMVEPAGKFDKFVFPFDSTILWNRDNFGPLVIPQKGAEISLTLENISIYWRLIEVFEGNEISVQDSTIIINGRQSNTYIPKQDYYFICNDNRDNSFDSRYFGFLPNDHISGKIIKIIN